MWAVTECSRVTVHSLELEKGGWINFSQERKEAFVTLQTAACRMASNPPSGASRLRDTICFCTSSLKRSTLSVSERMWRKPKDGTQLEKSLYLCRVTRKMSTALEAAQKGASLFYRTNMTNWLQQADFKVSQLQLYNCCLTSTSFKCRLLFLSCMNRVKTSERELSCYLILPFLTFPCHAWLFYDWHTDTHTRTTEPMT